MVERGVAKAAKERALVCVCVSAYIRGFACYILSIVEYNHQMRLFTLCLSQINFLFLSTKIHLILGLAHTQNGPRFAYMNCRKNAHAAHWLNC